MTQGAYGLQIGSGEGVVGVLGLMAFLTGLSRRRRELLRSGLFLVVVGI